ncbi:hypothetical protein CHUAL_008644 [Chamberlinius hualienensis]
MKSSTSKLDLYRIELDDFSATYQSGQIISGVVKVHLNEPMSITGIYVHLQGKSKVRWNSKDSDSSGSESSSIEKSHTFYDHKFALPHTESASRIGSGKLNFPFSLTLPQHLPSSVEGKYGSIRYTCSSKIGRPRRFDPKCKTTFTVLEPVDLNAIPDCQLPVTLGQFQVISSDKGSVSSKLSLNRKGFLPGEKIEFQADIYNNSVETIECVYVNLISVFIYTSGSDRTREKRLLNSVCLGNVLPRSTMHSENKGLLVPPASPSIPENKCPLVMVEYFAQLKMKLPEMEINNLNITIPITIGSIALKNEKQNS